MKRKINLTDDDRTRLQEEVREGRQAEGLISDPAFVGACRKVEERFTRAWRESEPSDTQGREIAYMKVHALTEVVKQIVAAVEQGRDAQAKLEHLERLDEAQTH